MVEQNLNRIIAVVDNDESVCRALKRLLRSVGIEAQTFSSGEEFLHTLTSTASCWPGCVILDVQMPDRRPGGATSSCDDWRVGRLHYRERRPGCSRKSS